MLLAETLVITTSIHSSKKALTKSNFWTFWHITNVAMGGLLLVGLCEFAFYESGLFVLFLSYYTISRRVSRGNFVCIACLRKFVTLLVPLIGFSSSGLRVLESVQVYSLDGFVYHISPYAYVYGYLQGKRNTAACQNHIEALQQVSWFFLDWPWES